MTRAEALNRLRSHRASLHAMGIEHVAIFGSTARDEATPTSDLDLFVTFQRDVRLGWDYLDLDERIGIALRRDRSGERHCQRQGEEGGQAAAGERHGEACALCRAQVKDVARSHGRRRRAQHPPRSVR